MGNPTKELLAKLDELGVEYDTYDLPNGEHGVSWIDGNNIEWEAVQLGENFEIHALQLVTPEQAVAATVGNAVYGIEFADWCEFPPEAMVGETVFDGKGNAIGWIVNATMGAGTCKRVYHPNRITKTCTCSNCGYGASDERWAYCPKCGHKYVHGEVEEMWKRAGRKVAE